MRTKIATIAAAIIAVVIGIASFSYAYWLHTRPSLPYFEPHHVEHREGIGVAYPGKNPGVDV